MSEDSDEAEQDAKNDPKKDPKKDMLHKWTLLDDKMLNEEVDRMMHILGKVKEGQRHRIHEELKVMYAEMLQKWSPSDNEELLNREVDDMIKDGNFSWIVLAENMKNILEVKGGKRHRNQDELKVIYSKPILDEEIFNAVLIWGEDWKQISRIVGKGILSPRDVKNRFNSRIRSMPKEYKVINTDVKKLRSDRSNKRIVKFLERFPLKFDYIEGDVAGKSISFGFINCTDTERRYFGYLRAQSPECKWRDNVTAIQPEIPGMHFDGLSSSVPSEHNAQTQKQPKAVSVGKVWCLVSLTTSVVGNKRGLENLPDSPDDCRFNDCPPEKLVKKDNTIFQAKSQSDNSDVIQVKAEIVKEYGNICQKCKKRITEMLSETKKNPKKAKSKTELEKETENIIMCLVDNNKSYNNLVQKAREKIPDDKWKSYNEQEKSEKMVLRADYIVHAVAETCLVVNIDDNDTKKGSFREACGDECGRCLYLAPSEECGRYIHCKTGWCLTCSRMPPEITWDVLFESLSWRDQSEDDPQIKMLAARILNARRATEEKTGETFAGIFPSGNAAAYQKIVEQSDLKRASHFFVEEFENIVWKVVSNIPEGEERYKSYNKLLRELRREMPDEQWEEYRENEKKMMEAKAEAKRVQEENERLLAREAAKAARRVEEEKRARQAKEAHTTSTAGGR